MFQQFSRSRVGTRILVFGLQQDYSIPNVPREATHLCQKSSPRPPGSFHGVAMPGFVHVGFLPATGIAFLALFPKHLSLLVEVFFHLGACLSALQDPSVLLCVDKGRSRLGRSHHLLLDILEVLLLLLLCSLLHSHLRLWRGSGWLL